VTTTHKDNIHPNKHPHLKLLTTGKNDIHNTHRRYSSQKNNLVKEKPIVITKTEPHPKKPFSRDQTSTTTAHPPIRRKNTKQKAKTKIEPKN